MKKTFKASIVLSLLTILSCQNSEIVQNINIEPVNQEVNVFSKPDNASTGFTEWGESVKNLTTTKKIKQTTFLSYLAFDNNKESDRKELKPVINTHELAGSTDSFNQIILTDGDKDGDLKKYYIINEKTNTIKSPYIQYKKEHNTASYSVLHSFLKWGFNNYPSKTKIFDINSHGVGFSGIALDKTSDSYLPIPDLAKAIKNAVGKIDIFVMDACLMSSVEVAYELKDVSEIIVSSQDNTLRTGMKYIKYLPDILKKSKNNTQIAEQILEKSDRTGVIENDRDKRLKTSDTPTISAVRNSDMDRLVYHINSLSRMLLNRMDVYRQRIKDGLSNTHALEVNKTNIFDGGQRDFHEVIARIEIELNKEKSFSSQDSDIKNMIQTAREAANRAIIVSLNHKDEKWAEGISINISPNAIKTEKFKNLKFAKDTLWDELITELYKY
jgi:hypothetical protein